MQRRLSAVWPDHSLILIDPEFPAILNETRQRRRNVIPTAEDLPFLYDGEWLNDVVISFYLDLLVTRAVRKGVTGLAVLDPQVLSKVKMVINESAVFVEKNLVDMVCRWLIKPLIVKPDADRILIACNEERAHWSIAEAIVSDGRVDYYCSADGDVAEQFKKLIEVLFRTLSRVKQYRKFDRVWTFKNVRGIPRQSDRCSCGLYLCAFADSLALGKRPCGFGSAHIQSLREALRELIAACQ